MRMKWSLSSLAPSHNRISLMMMIRIESDPSPGWTICADSVITRTISASDEDDADYDKEIRNAASAPSATISKIALLNLYGIMR